MTTVSPNLNEVSCTPHGDVAIVTLKRPLKRNALNDGLVLALEHHFNNLPHGTKAVNYAFDVTPARLVSGLVTERGVTRASSDWLAAMFPEQAAAV